MLKLFLLFALLAQVVICQEKTINNVIGRYRVSPWRKRSIAGVKFIVVHHSASTGTGGSDDAELRALQNVHVKTNGWPGLSYHFVIMKNGNIYQINNLDDNTYTDTINVDSVAVLMHGYFHAPFNQQPTAAQLSSLQFMLRNLMGRFNLPHTSIRGHRDRTSTACPGDIMYRIVTGYRNNGVPGATPTPPPPPISNRLPAGRGCVQANVNLRDNAGTGSTVITTVPDGATVDILGAAPIQRDGLVWYNVQAGNNRGWMAQAADGTTFLTSCPAPAPPPPSDLTWFTGLEVCATAPSNLRSTACGDVVTTLPSGSRVMVTGTTSTDCNGYTWYPVSVDNGNQRGFIAQAAWWGRCLGKATYTPEGWLDTVTLTPEERAAQAEESAAAEDQTAGAPALVSFAAVVTLVVLMI